MGDPRPPSPFRPPAHRARARLLHRGRTRRGPVAREVPAARQEDLPAAVARRPDPLPGEMVVRRGAVPGADGGLGGGAVAPGRTSQSVLARGRRRAAGRVPRRRPRLRRGHTARRGRCGGFGRGGGTRLRSVPWRWRSPFRSPSGTCRCCERCSTAPSRLHRGSRAAGSTSAFMTPTLIRQGRPSSPRRPRARSFAASPRSCGP